MPRWSNNLKWSAELIEKKESVDPFTDRVISEYEVVRKINYSSIGVTSADRHFSRQDGNEVTKKIEVRLDRSIEEDQKKYRIKIKEKIYDIERIYVREDERMMELSLSYAD